MVFIDMHAEATAEKRALAEYIDGRVAAVIGTHTHVQTADDQISANGTAFITDAGMTGCHDSIIGLKTDVALKRFLYQTPHKYEEALGSHRIQGVVIKVEEGSNRAVSIRRLSLPDFNRG
jgi:calcineurin-like phosphoesterase